jgi:hypothetical protein
MALTHFNLSTDFAPPFLRVGKIYRKRTIKLRGSSGVYLIRENGVLVYVGFSSSCLTEALYRHFYQYNDAHRKTRVYYDPSDTSKEYTVAVIYANHEEAAKLERGFILAFEPRDNTEYLKTNVKEVRGWAGWAKWSPTPVSTAEDDDLPF